MHQTQTEWNCCIGVALEMLSTGQGYTQVPISEKLKPGCRNFYSSKCLLFCCFRFVCFFLLGFLVLFYLLINNKVELKGEVHLKLSVQPKYPMEAACSKTEESVSKEMELPQLMVGWIHLVAY